MQALVLDLRSNPGGVFDAGVAVAGMLVPKGPIVSVVDKNGNKYEETSSLEKVKYPLAVLVDHGSASAAEIVAGAIKDTKSGKLFGTKTFGKGSVQSVYRLDSNTAVKITVAKYYTPSGVSIHNVGIEPDVEGRAAGGCYCRCSAEGSGGLSAAAAAMEGTKMLFICYPKCSTCKKAEQYLQAKGLSFTVRDIKTDNPTADELRTWYAASGLPLKRFFNTSGNLYKQLGLKDKLPTMSEDEQLELLASDQLCCQTSAGNL